jgi:hypothetical protein
MNATIQYSSFRYFVSAKDPLTKRQSFYHLHVQQAKVWNEGTTIEKEL